MSSKNKGERHDMKTPRRRTPRRPCSSLKLPTSDEVKKVNTFLTQHKAGAIDNLLTTLDPTDAFDAYDIRDGIPNYKDNDDDNDNVLTKDENPDPNGDGDISDAQNTDGTDEPDYLDTDDDNDSVITRYEDANLNGNLFDDFEPGSTLPRFLDPAFADTFVNDVLNANSFTRVVTVNYMISNVDIEILSSDGFDFGSFEIIIQN